jgi:hypothetical protein
MTPTRIYLVVRAIDTGGINPDVSYRPYHSHEKADDFVDACHRSDAILGVRATYEVLVLRYAD